MSAALQQISETREALQGALAQRDWQAIGELDLACRACVEAVLSDAPADDAELRSGLEGLLGVYQELLEVTASERKAVVDEMMQIRQAKNAAKVYHLFG